MPTDHLFKPRTEEMMGKNYDTDAELRSIEVWICKTCGRTWPVEGIQSNWTSEDAEKAARTCCSENSPCFVCGDERTRYPHHACDKCSAMRNLERWEKCEVRPLEFPLTTQDNDRWFYDEDELREYCEEYEVKEHDLFLRIGTRVIPRCFEPSEFWCDDIAEDDDPCDDGECNDLANKINEWGKGNIVAYEMGPFRPDLSDD